MSGRKHERIHQCIRCGEYDVPSRFCLGGLKDIYDPKIIIYCSGFKPLTKKEDPE